MPCSRPPGWGPEWLECRARALPAPKKAYAILAGGGVKGAALAGCLAHAKRLGIEFVGYGGSSAGALVATLAAIGNRPDQLHRILVDRPFVDLVSPDDAGARLRQLSGLLPAKWSKWSIAGMLARSFNHLPMLSGIATDCGLLDGTALTKFLGDEFDARGIPREVRFSQLRSHIGGTSLKIMCTDLTLRKAVEFGTGGNPARDPEVITAVRASCGYPVIFKPQPDIVEYQIPNSQERRSIRHQLVDGGLASNLPISLFYKESEEHKIPIIAFDLVQTVAPHEGTYTMNRMLADLFATALGSGDTMAQRLMSSVIHVPIIIPPDINTFDIHLKPSDAQRLFDTGLKGAEKILGLAAPTIPGMLEAMIKQSQLRWPATTGLRAAVLAPDGSGMLTISHAFNMEGAPDLSLRVPIGAGVAGAVWRANAPRAMDPRRGMSGLSQEQLARIPPDRRAMVSFPVRAPSRAAATPQPVDPIAVLTIDSSAPLEATGWLDDPDTLSEFGEKWAQQIAELLVKDDGK